MVEYRTLHGMIFSDETEGALDVFDCPKWHRRKCHCGNCSICGNPKHSAIHGPSYGQAAGSKPFGHAFVEVK